MFVQLNPIQFTLDTATCLWFNKFIQNVIGERVSGVIFRTRQFCSFVERTLNNFSVNHKYYTFLECH